MHARPRKRPEAHGAGSAKLFVKGDGDTEVVQRGRLTDRELATIRRFIKENYLDMYETWARYSDNGFKGE